MYTLMGLPLYSAVVIWTDTVDTKAGCNVGTLPWGSSDLPSTTASRPLTITL